MRVIENKQFCPLPISSKAGKEGHPGEHREEHRGPLLLPEPDAHQCKNHLSKANNLLGIPS